MAKDILLFYREFSWRVELEYGGVLSKEERAVVYHVCDVNNCIPHLVIPELKKLYFFDKLIIRIASPLIDDSVRKYLISFVYKD